MSGSRALSRPLQRMNLNNPEAPRNSRRGKEMIPSKSGLPSRMGTHSEFAIQRIADAGNVDLRKWTAGNVWTMSPSELGLTIRIDIICQKTTVLRVGVEDRPE